MCAHLVFFPSFLHGPLYCNFVHHTYEISRIIQVLPKFKSGFLLTLVEILPAHGDKFGLYILTVLSEKQDPKSVGVQLWAPRLGQSVTVWMHLYRMRKDIYFHLPIGSGWLSYFHVLFLQFDYSDCFAVPNQCCFYETCPDVKLYILFVCLVCTFQWGRS